MAKSKRKELKKTTMKIYSHLKKFKLLWSLGCKPKSTFKSRRNRANATNLLSVPDDAPTTSFPVPDDVAMTVDAATTSLSVPEVDVASTSSSVQGVEATPITIPSLWHIDPTTNKPVWNADVTAALDYDGVEATLALTYPPGFLFKDGKFADPNYRMPPNITGGFGLHGVFEPPTMHTDREIVGKAEFHFEEDFIDRLHPTMPYVGRHMCQYIIDRERRKHGKNLDFLDDDSYPVFAVDVYERYELGELLSFIFTTLHKTDIPVWEYSCYSHDWIGIRLGDLASISEMYPPLRNANANRKLTFRLLNSNVFENHFIPYEVHGGVTRDQELMAAGPVACLVEESKTKVPSPDSIILLCNLLHK